MEFIKQIVCSVVGAVIGGLTGILIGGAAGASDLSTLRLVIQRLEMACDAIRAEEEREKAITEASDEHTD